MLLMLSRRMSSMLSTVCYAFFSVIINELSSFHSIRTLSLYGAQRIEAATETMTRIRLSKEYSGKEILLIWL